MAHEEVLTGLVLVLVFFAYLKKYFGQRKNLLENVLDFGISLIHTTKRALPCAFSCDNFVWCEYQETLQSEFLLKTEHTKITQSKAIEPKQIVSHLLRSLYFVSEQIRSDKCCLFIEDLSVCHICIHACALHIWSFVDSCVQENTCVSEKAFGRTKYEVSGKKLFSQEILQLLSTLICYFSCRWH